MFQYTDNEFRFIEYYNKHERLPLESQNIDLNYQRVIQHKLSTAALETDKDTIEYQIEIIKNTISWLKEKIKKDKTIYRTSEESEAIHILDNIYFEILTYLRERKELLEEDLNEILKTSKFHKDLTVAERVLILSYLQDENLFIPFEKIPSLEQSRIHELVSILFGIDKSSIKSAFQKIDTIKTEPLTKSQVSPKLKNLTNILPIIERLEQSIIIEKINKRIKEIESYANKE